MFDLHKLGWHSFQQLSLTILREILGQTVESFLDSADGGRDGAFSGTWKLSEKEDLSGTFVFQCKHTNRTSHNLSLSDVSDEISKAERLVKENKCDCYILITNAGTSGTVIEQITTELLKVGVKKTRVFGSTWISTQIQENKRLRMLVPRVYGLGDLSEILDERAYDQAKILLNSLREELAKVVITGTYQRAVDAINEHGFVLLVGEPAAGKTTIASLLSIAALDQWGTFTMKVNKASEVVKHWNTKDPRQFFWVDDAFGVTQYESPLTYDWNHIALNLKAMLRDGVKIVMTSRDYIYNRARKDLKHSAFPLLQESQVVIDVHNLTIVEKQQILYNHLKLGKQSKEFRKEIKPFLEEISKLSQFVPEVARRLSDPAFTKKLILHSLFLKKFVEEPEEFLREVIEGLDNDSKAALGLIYIRNDSLESPLELSAAETIAIERLNSNLGGCIAALEGMRNSLVYLLQTEDSYFWKFKHPTIGDAYGSILIKNPELMEIYIQGSSAEELTGLVTCGDVGIQQAVIIPKKFYPLILKKLEQFKFSDKHKTESWAIWEAKRRLHSFLSNRCSKEFLELYLGKHAKLLEDISNPGLYLDHSPDVRLVIRLHELNLLPEDYRVKFIRSVSDYAVQGDDFHVFENPTLQKIFTFNEYRNLRRKVREIFIPNLRDWRTDRQSDFSNYQSPKDHMEPYLDSLKLLKKTFPQIKFTSQIEEQIQHIQEWVTEAEENRPEDIGPRKKLETVEINETFKESRSIFDDIDE
jgi:energy-coupling factor transporter ATP-binding protein EcfA2